MSNAFMTVKEDKKNYFMRIALMFFFCWMLCIMLCNTQLANAKAKDGKTDVYKSLSEEDRNFVDTAAELIGVPEDYKLKAYYVQSISDMLIIEWEKSDDVNLEVEAWFSLSGLHCIHFSFPLDYTTEEHEAYTEAELQELGLSMMKKLNPEINDGYELKEVIPHYGKDYLTCFSFRRKTNGLSVITPYKIYYENSFNFYIDSFSGKVMYANFNWDYDIEFPKAKTKISEKEAFEALVKELEQSVALKTVDYRDENGKLIDKIITPYFPILSASINVKTGKVTFEKDEDYKERVYSEFGDGDGYGDMVRSGDSDEDYKIHFKGRQIANSQVKDTIKKNKLISSEEALTKLNADKKLYISDKLTKKDIGLFETEDGFYWGIYMKNDVKNPGYYDEDHFDKDGNLVGYPSDRYYLIAAVDAENGQLILFNATSKKADSKKQLKYSKKKCKKIANKYVKSNFSEGFASSKLDRIGNSGDAYTFYYTRLSKDGIRFPENGIYVAVDRVSGKIIRYGYTWNNEADFSEAEMSTDYTKVAEIIYDIKDKNLVYYVEENKGQPRKAVLMYYYGINEFWTNVGNNDAD